MKNAHDVALSQRPALLGEAWRHVQRLAEKISRGQRRALVWIGVLLIVYLHAIPFTYGYRMSADDAAFTRQFMEGAAAAMQSGAMDAHLNGRIGMFLLRPLNIAAAYLSGNPGMRVAFVALYFLNFLLFSMFVSRVLRRNVTPLLFLILVVGNPLAFEHMPPNAYALQNTLPFALILASRIALLGLRAARPRSWSMAGEAAALVLFGACMCLSEYATIFGTALLVTEYWARSLDQQDPAATPLQGLIAVARHRDFRMDAVVVLAALAAYGSFRWFNPSHYDGNHPDGIFHVARLGVTTAGHIWSGTTLGQLTDGLPAMGWVPLMGSVIVGAMTGICGYLLLRAVDSFHRRLGWGWLAVAIFCAIFVTFPVAVTLKQQSWCLDGGSCGFLDSRSSYFWVGLGILFAASVLLTGFRARRSYRFTLALASAGLGLLSMLTYANNQVQGERMRSISSAWKRADLLACMPGAVPRNDDELKSLIDPRGQVMFHPDVSQRSYWRQYVTQKPSHENCPDDPHALQRAFSLHVHGMHPLRLGKKLKFSRAADLAYLGGGWSAERWGVWSVGRRAEVRFRVDGAAGDLVVSFHALKHQAGRASKPVTVELNGRQMAAFDLRDAPLPYSFRIAATHVNTAVGGGNVLAFLVVDPISPLQAGSGEDIRPLGIGLVDMTIEDAGPGVRVRSDQ